MSTQVALDIDDDDNDARLPAPARGGSSSSAEDVHAALLAPPAEEEEPTQARTRRHAANVFRPRYAGLLVAGFLFTAFLTAVGIAYYDKVARRAAARKRNLIFMVSDGFGPASQTLARNYHTYTNNLSFDTQLPLDKILVGTSRTRSSSQLVTDSAAGATAFSCALKTYNGAIGVDPDQRPCGTVLEAAKLKGMATGLVVTSRITHATPASFSAHNIDRDNEAEIALHQIGAYKLGRMVDVAFGGGLRFFLPNTTAGGAREDGLDLVREAADKYGFSVLKSRGEFDALDGSSKLPLLGLFASDHMSYEIDRVPEQQPSLKEMVGKALAILTAATRDSPHGFFLMIEGSRIDMAAHSNDPATHVHEILQYNAVIETVQEYIDAHPATVMVSTSDHETGGLSVARQLDVGHAPEYDWHPRALERVTNSTIVLAQAVLAKRGALSRGEVRGYIAHEVLEKSLGVTNYTDADLDRLSDEDVADDLDKMLADFVSREALLGWATHGHSAVDVNLYAHGLYADRLRGNHENTEIGQFIVNYFGLDLAYVTGLLRSS